MFVYKAHSPAHIRICAGEWNTVDERKQDGGFIFCLHHKSEATMLRAIIWFSLGFFAGKYVSTPLVKSVISKGTEKAAEVVQHGADYIKEEFSPSQKDRRNEILFRKFSL